MKLITAHEAAKLIPDNSIVAIGGMGLSGWPEEIACAIRDRYRECGHPHSLYLKQGCDMGDWNVRGVSRLGEAGEGLVTQWTTAHLGTAYALHPYVYSGKINCHCLPQGVIVNLWREIAAGRPGLLTKVGLGTFIDPRYGGGKMNDSSHADLVELVEFNGEEYLFYKAFKPDIALLRGTIADENGNITFENDSLIHESPDIAAAVKNNGGTVIVQVQYLAKSGTLNPKDIRIPGIMVDYVVVATDRAACWQEEKNEYDPSISGRLKKPLTAMEPMPFDARKVICRRAACELRRGYLINQGVGVPAGISKVANEEGCLNLVTPSSEAGAIGGVMSYAPSASFNVEAFVPHADMFNYIDGGRLDLTCLGIGQVDRFGNNNVCKFGKKITGCGGFIDITSATKNIVFCGTFTSKAKIEVGNGRLSILEEGTPNKFVNDVESVTFSAKYASREQRVLYVTERCVFELLDGVFTLTEIAPGIDLHRHILDLLPFSPAISPNLKVMDEGIFNEVWGGLKDYIDL
ncbi:MAG: acyl CoA:acetate/3-ketoacid CoA transferase [Oscillospiraceae bacterium]|nr:acyl CoA:acetate/3-ketoacid CoA transferase [Oscillospiraceae bacterium]